MADLDDIPPEPWERQLDESPPAWEAFALYRDQPPAQRSVREVARCCVKSRSLIARWSSTHQWVVRAAAWDKRQDRIKQAAMATELEQLARQNVKRALQAHEIVAKKIEGLSADDIAPGDLPRWLSALATLERQVRGESVYRVEHSGPGGGPIEHAARNAKQRLATLIGAPVDAAKEAGVVAKPQRKRR